MASAIGRGNLAQPAPLPEPQIQRPNPRPENRMSLPVSPYRVVDGVVIDAIERGLTPGATFEICSARKTLHKGAYGFAEQRPVRRTVENGTIWDLASLTKVLCTAPLF